MTAREQSFLDDEPACGIRFAWPHTCCVCALIQGHSGACECGGCGHIDADGFDEAVRERNDEHGYGNRRAM